MNKKFFIAPAIIAGLFFCDTKASANTINIPISQKQESPQLISQNQNTNIQAQDLQLQSSTNSINDNQELAVWNQSNVMPVVLNAKVSSNKKNIANMSLTQVFLYQQSHYPFGVSGPSQISMTNTALLQGRW